MNLARTNISRIGGRSGLEHRAWKKSAQVPSIWAIWYDRWTRNLTTIEMERSLMDQHVVVTDTVMRMKTRRTRKRARARRDTLGYAGLNPLRCAALNLLRWDALR